MSTHLGYEFHEYANIFPLSEGECLQELVDNIREKGLIDDITLYEGKILDGRNRYRACLAASVKPRFVEWSSKGESALDFSVARNSKRRDLTENQRAMAAQKAKAIYEREARARIEAGAHVGGETAGRGRPKDDSPAANSRQGKPTPDRSTRTSHKLGKDFKISPRAVDAAGKVVRDGIPELAAAVEKDETTVYSAAEIATLPKDEQRAVVSAGTSAIKERVRRMRICRGAQRGNRIIISRSECKTLRDISVRLVELSKEPFTHWQFGSIQKLHDDLATMIKSFGRREN